MAAAVVKEPAGSAKTEMPKGGTMAFLAALDHVERLEWRACRR